MRAIRMARHVNERVRRMGYRNWIAWMVNQALGWGNLEIPWSHPQGEVQAYVTVGLWYATCPGCKTPVLVDDREPVFFCPTCLCAENDGHPYVVSFQGKREVEELFARRKDPRTRNWVPGESLADLEKEQRAKGEL